MLHKCFLLLLLLLAAPTLTPAGVIEQVLVVVNGEPYTLSNLNRYAKEKMSRGFPTGNLEQINSADREVLEQFITDKLLEAEVREAGLGVSEDEVSRYIEQVKKNQPLVRRRSQGCAHPRRADDGQLPGQRQRELEKSEIIERQVRRKVNITDEDVERYYKLNTKNYRSPERARIRHILFAVPENAPPAQVQAAMEKSNELYQRIIAGARTSPLWRASIRKAPGARRAVISAGSIAAR
jgi:peptidyl-prolyl cis-trans isomerase SurA